MASLTELIGLKRELKFKENVTLLNTYIFGTNTCKHTLVHPLGKKEMQSNTYVNRQIQELCHSLHCNSGIIFSHYSNILE